MKVNIMKPLATAGVFALTALVGMLVKKGLKTGWRKTTHKEPPVEPKASGWSATMIWVAVTGLVASFSKFFTSLARKRVAGKV